MKNNFCCQWLHLGFKGPMITVEECIRFFDTQYELVMCQYFKMYQCHGKKNVNTIFALYVEEHVA
jgi:hypothetical protein